MLCLALETGTEKVEESGLQEQGILGDCSGFDMLRANVLDPHPPKPQLLTQSPRLAQVAFYMISCESTFLCSLETDSMQRG